MNLQMDPLDNPLTTRPIQTGCKMSIEPYPNCWFGSIDNPDHQSGNGSVPTCTHTRSAGPEPLLTLPIDNRYNEEDVEGATSFQKGETTDLYSIKSYPQLNSPP